MPAGAGAWVQSKGKAQVIVKGEAMRADDAFDPDGKRVTLAVERRDTTVGVFAEYGLSGRMTLQVKGDWQDGQDAFVDYQGRGPIEIGLVWQAWRNDRGAVSLYAGYASAGDGRNAGYAAPGVGQDDWEVRASAGWTFDMKKPTQRWRALLYPQRSFVEVQVARRMRDGLPDETRADFTFGRHLGNSWMMLNQIYSGETDGGGARWVQTESSVVRQVGSWSIQAGWRQPLGGREVPATRGPVLAIWRRF